MSKKKNTAKEPLEPESMTGSLTTPQSLGISEHSIIAGPKAIKDWLMSLPQASHVSHFQSPGKDWAQRIPVTCGPKHLKPLGWYDLKNACWRTFQGSLFQDTLEPFPEAWPRSGMTVNGLIYPLPMLVPPIEETEHGFCPTPLTSDSRGYSRNKEYHKKRQSRNLSFPSWVALKYGTHGKIHPNCSEIVMGWPIGWTDLKPLEMDKYQLWLQQHGIY